MKVLIAVIGSAGDVHPSIAIAQALQRRGHAVSIATNPYFAPLLERVGLPLVPVGTTDQFHEALNLPGLWTEFGGIRFLGRAAEAVTAEMYRTVERETTGGAVVVAHPLAFGARIAHETLAVPLVTVHLAPASFWSIDESPVPTNTLSAINRLPRALRRLLFAGADRYMDRLVAPPINRFRAELDLPPVRHIGSRWWHSPQRVIGMFPDWFAAPQADWPPRTALTGFPLYDESGVSPVPADLDAFLEDAAAAGAPPILFLPGSGNLQARRFFAAAVDACQRLDRRGVLLTRYPGQLPAPLPGNVHHAAYAPLSAVLPRAAALVHHGGIGTAAQALAAGRPQLVMPMAFDQPDNAARLARLGVARILKPARFNGARVAREITALLDSRTIAARCAAVARRLEGGNPLDRTCELIEACAR